jgi:hypothetical protein
LSAFVSREDAVKLVKDSVKAALAEERSKTDQQRDQSDVRERFIRKNMSDLPMFMQNALPKAGDLGKLASAEQSLRGELVEWVKKLPGYKFPNVSGDAGGASHSHATTKADTSQSAKETPSSLVSEGLKSLR